MASSLVKDLNEIDALPYVDGEYQGSLKREVDRMIQLEMSKFEPENYLESLPELSFSLSAMEPLDYEQYDVCILFLLSSSFVLLYLFSFRHLYHLQI